MWMTPKTDWTAQDFLDLEVDFSRIEGNIHELLLTVQDYGYPLTLDEKTAWTKQDFLTAADYNRIVGNIASLEGILIVPARAARTVHKSGQGGARLYRHEHAGKPHCHAQECRGRDDAIVYQIRYSTKRRPAAAAGIKEDMHDLRICRPPGRKRRPVRA